MAVQIEKINVSKSWTRIDPVQISKKAALTFLKFTYNFNNWFYHEKFQRQTFYLQEQ